MPIGAITMILTNVGLQIYNNWCGSRQNDKLQQKREEFERAARERNTEHMWKLLREGQDLTMQLEKEKHDDRLKELKDEVDHLLERLTYEATITNWPLKVLPIVMKNQAFGNLLANQEEHVALHVIFTRSNYNKFNKLVYPIIEKELEQYCDKHWSTMTDHPVLFYSGAWKPMNSPTDVQVKAMREELKNLPTLLITPFFRPGDGKLVFQVHMWGVGPNSSDKFIVPEIEPVSDEFHFQRTYTNQQDYEKEVGLFDEIVEDLVPYLECMIGYMADTYFLSSSGLAPHFPALISNGTINIDGMPYLLTDSREYYDKLFVISEEKAKENPFVIGNLLNLFEGSSELWDEESKEKKLEDTFVKYCNRRCNNNFSTIDEVLNSYPFSKIDSLIIDSYLRISKNVLNKDSLTRIKDNINNDEDACEDDLISTLSDCNISDLKSQAEMGNAVASYRLGELYEYSIGVEYNPDEFEKYYSLSRDLGFTLADIRYKIFDLGGKSITNSDVAYLQKNETAQFLIFRAICLYNGYGEERSVEEAMDELEKLSDSTHPYAYYLSAQIVKEQYGEDQGELLVDLLLKSANLGYVEAQVDLMNIYYEGQYVAESPQLCVEFAQKAALQAHPEALFTLAICLIRGYGTKCNRAKAKELLKLAAERGNDDAIEILKSMSK